VLLQQGKGGDIAAAFGGGGSQTAFGARAGATVLTKATAVLGVLFMLGAIALGIYGQRGEGSLLVGRRRARPRRSRPRAARIFGSVRALRTDRARPPSNSRKWRNWQTHQLEGLAMATSWGFESPLSHHSTRPLRGLARGRP
jgi:preprotein translocase subunit SecG